jgi:hypothetical protein
MPLRLCGYCRSLPLGSCMQVARNTQQQIHGRTCAQQTGINVGCSCLYSLLASAANMCDCAVTDAIYVKSAPLVWLEFPGRLGSWWRDVDLVEGHC